VNGFNDIFRKGCRREFSNAASGNLIFAVFGLDFQNLFSFVNIFGFFSVFLARSYFALKVCIRYRKFRLAISNKGKALNLLRGPRVFCR